MECGWRRWVLGIPYILGSCCGGGWYWNVIRWLMACWIIIASPWLCPRMYSVWWFLAIFMLFSLFLVCFFPLCKWKDHITDRRCSAIRLLLSSGIHSHRGAKGKETCLKIFLSLLLYCEIKRDIIIALKQPYIYCIGKSIYPYPYTKPWPFYHPNRKQKENQTK